MDVGEDDDAKIEDDQLISGQRLLAESFGTFALTFAATAGPIVDKLSPEGVPLVARAGAPGLTIMAMIYALGQISGAHFNPAVTVSFALRRDFPWRRVPGYLAAEFAGAFLAALVLRGVFGDVVQRGATVPKHGDVRALAFEVVLTLLLVSVVLGTATRHQVIGADAALAVGGTVALCGFIGAPISGASMNPALSFGPMLVGHVLSAYWIYLVGPLTGAGLACVLGWGLHRGHSHSEVEAATGSE